MNFLTYSQNLYFEILHLSCAIFTGNAMINMYKGVTYYASMKEYTINA